MAEDLWPMSKPEDQAVIDDLCVKSARRLRELIAREVAIATAMGPAAAFAVVTTLAYEAAIAAAGYTDIVVNGRRLSQDDHPSVDTIAAVCAGILGVEDHGADVTTLIEIAARGAAHTKKTRRGEP